MVLYPFQEMSLRIIGDAPGQDTAFVNDYVMYPSVAKAFRFALSVKFVDDSQGSSPLVITNYADFVK